MEIDIDMSVVVVVNCLASVFCVCLQFFKMPSTFSVFDLVESFLCVFCFIFCNTKHTI